MNKISGIYCIENKINNKKYIGQSIDILSRWRQHKSALNNKRHHSYDLQNEWDIYGEENFIFYILEMIDDPTLRNNSEINYIRIYDTTNKNCGYNIESGGIIRDFVTEESKKKISMHHADVSGCNNPFYGKTHSEETINKMINNVNYINTRPRGERSHTNKISEHDVVEIKKYFSNPSNNKRGALKEIAKKYNVSTSIVSHIKNGYSWGWLTV